MNILDIIDKLKDENIKKVIKFMCVHGAESFVPEDVFQITLEDILLCRKVVRCMELCGERAKELQRLRQKEIELSRCISTEKSQHDVHTPQQVDLLSPCSVLLPVLVISSLVYISLQFLYSV